MHRLLKAVLLVMTCALIGSEAFAQALPIVQVSGRLPQGNLRVFAKDTLYQVTGYYVVSGTLLIEPGTTVEFLPNSRLIDSVGGRIIADGDVDAIWNRNTSGVSAFPNRYCDVNYMRANVTTSGKPEITAPAPNHMNWIPLVLFYYANARSRCATDPNLANTQYRRDVIRAPITFRGRPINQFSREWGHIVVLPGADTAFFRNCNFVNFRKDITVVQSTQFYAPSTLTGYNSPQVTAGFNLNTQMQQLTTGGGGAMTVFSSKTWVLDCRFDSNFARYHGGAVQFLQAPFDATGLFYVQAPGAPGAPFSGTNPDVNFYPSVNPETYDLYGGSNAGDNIVTPFGTIPGMRTTVPAASAVTPIGTIQYRQAYDDGRMAINLGRVRRVIFRDNRVMVSDTTSDVSGYRDNVGPEAVYNYRRNVFTSSTPYNTVYSPLRRNEAFGGAMFISGRRLITVYLGRGSALQISGVLPNGDPTDTMIFERNHAVNFQDTTTLYLYNSANPRQVIDTFRSKGARGGAIYVGDATSLYFQLSRFQGNFTASPNVDEADFLDRGRMSQGGAVYMSATSPEFTALGNVLFRNNKSGQGGALYIQSLPDQTIDNLLSPIVGDSVWFISNRAEYDGGAIYTQRNIRLAATYLTSVNTSAPGNPIIDRRILLDSNAAGLAGGAIVIDNRTSPTLSRAAVENVLISNNTAGDTGRVADTRLIKIYDPVQSPMAVGAEFGTHTVRDDYFMPAAIIPEVLGGGGVYSQSGNTNFFRSVEFRHNYTIFGNGGAISLVLPGQRDNRYFLSQGDVAYDFTTGQPLPLQAGPEPTDQRQMTRFLANAAWKDMDANRILNQAPHGGTLSDPMRNGTGLGGAIYINDPQNRSNPAQGVARTDSVIMHRVRIEMDTAWSGSAVYSDNYDLRVVFNKSLIANNIAVSTEGAKVDTIQNYMLSPAANRTAGATFYGEIEGPMPSELYHTNANSIYDNQARFIIRLPDVPNVLAGIGLSGVDTVRGNYWGQTEAPVTTVLPSGTLQNTFYVQGDSCTLPLRNSAVVNQQGPFESPALYSYTPVPVGVIPDTLLMQGRVYDIFDKGRDIKAVDYSRPRLAPIEDFAVGIPPRLSRFGTGVYANQVVRRLTRDPFVADIDPQYRTLQREFVGSHPIGYPLFLEARANYVGDRNVTNDDQYALNHTVFFVINVETGELIRITLKQLAEGNNVFRGRAEFVADSINRDPIARRTFEGRAAFSIGEIYRLSPKFYLDTPGEIPAGITNPLARLEYARLRAAQYEDSVAVAGRRYGGRISPLEVGGSGFRYVNRLNPVTFADFYAGERYRALPVLTGDRIWVVSRTALWDTTGSITSVIDNARFTGMEFTIANQNSVMAPVIYAQRDSLENKTPTELRNTRFLTEDVNYVKDSTGRQISRIFEVTATDVNGFFDPRSIYFPSQFTGLRYEFNFLEEFFNRTTVPSNDPSRVRLASWLRAETVYPAANASTRDTAHRRGFLRFYGTPHNPDVVPGGELLEIRVSNYPPGIQTIDSLRGLLPDTIASRYIFLYPPYYNCQVYDVRNARYLNQDTVDVGGANTATYRMRIFVQDTPPVFEADSLPCTFARSGNYAVANLTNRLRFNLDFNTDDEREDNFAAGEGWRFPYGRTTYGFAFIARYPETGDTTSDDVREIRPVWMRDQYLQNPLTLQPDRGATFLTQGNLVVRIDSLAAINMLRNPGQANNAFNLDSIFTVVVHDGHMGQNKRDMRVVVNVAPQIQPVQNLSTLPTAKEDFEYNRAMRDTTRRIVASDLNFGQSVKYTLVYRNDTLNPANLRTGTTVTDSNGTQVPNTATLGWVRRDGCYPEAGLFPAPKTTPDWLKINEVSGMLYGTPGLQDAPRTNAVPQGPDTITVVVEDEFGLTDVRTFIMEVDSTQHRPHLFGRPAIVCIDPSQPYRDSLCVSDLDLPRIRFQERLTLRVLSPAGLTIAPSTVNGGAGVNDTICGLIVSAPANTIRDTGKVRVQIEVTDVAGNADTLTYQITVSEPVLFSMKVTVSNTITETGRRNAFQELEFGIGRNATTGEDATARGQLDTNYCEYELPPQPPRDVFDARWTIPTTNGILRNIFPQVPQAGQGPLSWKAVFQPGFLEGGSFNYPVRICWSVKDARRSPNPIHIMDQDGGTVFRVDMKNPYGGGVRIVPGSGVTLTSSRSTADTTDTTWCVEIIGTAIPQGFIITYNLTSGVDEPSTGAAGYMLLSNIPNPFSGSTEIGYYAPKSGNVRLDIFNMQGVRVKTLTNGVVSQGAHKALWNGTDDGGNVVPSGTYTYRLSAGTTILTRTLVLVR